MDAYKMFGVNIFLIFSFVMLVNSRKIINNDNTYGSYNMEVRNYGTCKGFKANNFSNVTTSLDENYLGVINITSSIETRITSIKVHVHSTRGKNNILWNYVATDPCKHVAFTLLIQRFLKTDNCTIKPGFYNVQTNFKEAILTILGTSFFYGTYYTKTDVITKNGHLACFTSTLILTKKTY